MDRSHEELLGKSSTFTAALEHISNLAAIDRPVLIIGERGTGKELAAQRLHFLSGRWDRTLIKVNCAAISDALLESELFGHEPGAFTGATRTHYGRFERADGGTLFLDELATMSTRLQEKLLRLIEYGEFERLGGQKTLRVDVRVIAATNANLREQAQRGDFREDLLDRLSFDVVHLPPLRYRSDDIEELANHFGVQMASELHWEYFAGFTHRALDTLNQYHWPGNVRELKNVVERSVYRWSNPQQPVDHIITDPFISPWGQTTESAPSVASTAVPSNNTNFYLQVQAFERELLQSALQTNNHHQTQTAKALGLTYHQLRGLLRKYQLGGKREKK